MQYLLLTVVVFMVASQNIIEKQYNVKVKNGNALLFAGIPEGETIVSGGQETTVKGGVAVLNDGTIAGSVSNLHAELKNLVSWGIPFETAVKAMTLTPAKAIKMDEYIGSIKEGKKADLVVLDDKLNIVAVYH